MDTNLSLLSRVVVSYKLNEVCGKRRLDDAELCEVEGAGAVELVPDPACLVRLFAIEG